MIMANELSECFRLMLNLGGQKGVIPNVAWDLTFKTLNISWYLLTMGYTSDQKVTQNQMVKQIICQYFVQCMYFNVLLVTLIPSANHIGEGT